MQIFGHIQFFFNIYITSTHKKHTYRTKQRSQRKYLGNKLFYTHTVFLKQLSTFNSLSYFWQPMKNRGDEIEIKILNIDLKSYLIT